MTHSSRVPEAPASLLPSLLVQPPWTRESTPRSAAPPVVQGLKRPKTPTVESWPPGLREKFRDVSDGWRDRETPVPDDVDFAAIAEYFRSGDALEDARGGRRAVRYRWLVLDGPDDLAHELLADERYFDDYSGWVYRVPLRRFAARRGLAAHPLLLHAAKKHLSCAVALVPFLDDATAQFMIKGMGVWNVEEASRAWFAWHGPAAAPFVIPDALRKPGPKRTQAENGLAIIVREHGRECVIEAAARYGEHVAEAIAASVSDPLDRYPDPLPEPDEDFVRERLPQVLLRGREHALPVSATRHLVTMLRISSPKEPYLGCEPVFEHLDPDSLAELAWALYTAEFVRDRWASEGVEYALRRLGNAGTATRLATAMGRWSKSSVWSWRGWEALDVLTALDSPDTLRLLDQLARKATDVKRMRPNAQGRLNTIARERGITPEQLADRLVPDFGLDDEGGLTLDYGPRRFRVGFDEELKPTVLDENGRRRKTLPKPGAKDDATLAPAAYKRFTDLKKEVRAVAADQIKRLEQAMISQRSWTPNEFSKVLAAHPLLRHIVRRLLWSAGTTHFRVAEDGTYADVDDNAFTLPTAPVTLAHPILVADLAPWSELFADYELLQPFPQLGRTVYKPMNGEATTSRLTRFEGASVPNGPIFGLTRAGWTLGPKESGGYQRHISLKLGEKQYLVLYLDPGIRILTPEDAPIQQIEEVRLATSSHGTGKLTFEELGPVLTSEALATLTKLTTQHKEQ
ncbi:uncharacterized protein DUF4132 [Actinomadura pelletieri DSM 43383]|uniref:Uncharacterized protein DUF4132 n=1 Tax=Actinomadura pelletieri DSM 43383 TaxID=1120940 RepID=A0A495R049_9ACTN|nr:uncharacterized protein DUF4132 [Actinomadura pelletieri DSM 43383]